MAASKVLCKTCKNETNHEIVHSHKLSWESDDLWGSDTYEIIRCLGCEEISFRHIGFFSEDYGPDGDLEEKLNIYPPRTENSLTAKAYYSASPLIRALYKQVIDTYNIQCWTLCAIGIRAIIEGICQEQGVKSGTILDSLKGTTRVSKGLDGKIAGLHEKGILSLKHSKLLHELRFLGNDAAHELIQPSASELILAIDVLEHTIENVYELDDKISSLRRLASRRKGKPK